MAKGWESILGVLLLWPNDKQCRIQEAFVPYSSTNLEGGFHVCSAHINLAPLIWKYESKIWEDREYNQKEDSTAR